MGKAEVRQYLKKEVKEMAASARDFSATVREAVRPPSSTAIPKLSGLLDPVRFKRFLTTVIKILILIELLSAFSKGLDGGGWAQFGFDLVIAGVLYIMWDKIRTLTKEKKEEYALKMKQSSHNVPLWDAFVFSLLWSDEIYQDIPLDRRRLVVISFTLIAIGLVVGIGSGLMALVMAGTLVLAAVNLLAWVVSSERGERETLQTELKLAHDVQTSLMPKTCPPVEGFDIAGQSFAAKEVGGDHFDYCYVGPEKKDFGITIFDVSGKGLHAAMSAVFTSGAFISEAKRSTSPAEIMTRLNTSIYRYSQRGHFVAFLFAVLDLAQKTVTFSNAGQMKPLLRNGNDVLWLDPAGATFPLGMIEYATYQERTVALHRGDILVFLTDGLTEAMNLSKEMYGADRLAEFVGHLATGNLSAEQIVKAINDDIQTFVGTASQHDDMTLVAVKVE